MRFLFFFRGPLHPIIIFITISFNISKSCIPPCFKASLTAPTFRRMKLRKKLFTVSLGILSIRTSKISNFFSKMSTTRERENINGEKRL